MYLMNLMPNWSGNNFLVEDEGHGERCVCARYSTSVPSEDTCRP